MANLDASLLGESNPGVGVVAHLVNNVLALEEDVAEDVEANARVALDTAEAAVSASRSVVDVLSRDGLLNATDSDGEGGERGAAGEGVASLGVVELGTADLGVVGADNGVINEDEGGASVEDTADRAPGVAVADAVSRGGEGPEALAVVGIDIGDRAGVLGAVDEAKVVGASGVVLESHGEKGAGKLVVHSVEEGSLCLGLNGVDGAKGKTEESISNVLAELGRHGGGGLDSLRSSCYTANSDLVSVHLSRCTGAIAVGDAP